MSDFSVFKEIIKIDRTKPKFCLLFLSFPQKNLLEKLHLIAPIISPICSCISISEKVFKCETRPFVWMSFSVFLAVYCGKLTFKTRAKSSRLIPICPSTNFIDY